MNPLNSQIIPAGAIVDFIYGPLIWLSFAIFGAGLIVQTWRYSMMTRMNDNPPLIPKKEIPASGTGSRWERFFYKLAYFRLSVIGFNPLLITVSLVFHFCLLITPLFLLAHNIMLENAIGFSLPSFLPGTSHLLTGIVLACGFFFILRRIMIRRVRAITTFYDYLILGLALAPFLTGFLAHQNAFDCYNTMILIHILSCEILLIIIPFSKFFHMIFFFFGRFLIINEYSLGAPKRSWQF